jgi:hypothetical protein
LEWHPLADDIFEDNEDMQALRTSIVTFSHALTVSLLFRRSFPIDVLSERGKRVYLYRGSP